MVDKKAQSTLTLKLKFVQNLDTLEITNSCLETVIFYPKVMDMLYKYKDTFSLRDEIGTCPNNEVEIDVIDNSPFFHTLCFRCKFW